MPSGRSDVLYPGGHLCFLNKGVSCRGLGFLSFNHKPLVSLIRLLQLFSQRLSNLLGLDRFLFR